MVALLLGLCCAEQQMPAAALSRSSARTPHRHRHTHAEADVAADEFLRSCAFSLADMHHAGQTPQWHSASSACAILGRYDGLLMMGDSLTRQVFEAFVQLLRGDLATGALRDDLLPDHRRFCTCNEFARNCRVFTEAWPPTLKWVDGAPCVSRELFPCPAAPHFRLQFYHIYVDYIREPATMDNFAIMRGAACAHPNSLVFVGGAPPHEQRESTADPFVKMDAKHAVRHLVGPMRNLSVQCGVPLENLIWAPMHWSNVSMIPEKWRERQRPVDILEYNGVTSAAARTAGLNIFDTYNMTIGARTLDGVHMPSPISMLKVQTLLARLEQQASRGGLAS